MGGDVMRQLSLFGDDDHPVGRVCPHFAGEFVGFAKCVKKPNPIYTCCNKWVCGEPPRCVWEEPDNSDAAKARRLEWMKSNRKG